MATGAQAGPAWSVWLKENQGLVFPATLLSSLVILIVPFPTWVMDMFLSVNITLAVLVFTATLLLRSPLEFNVFPTVLLATTLFRLVLNVATTRLILLNAAEEGEYAAGTVIRFFGDYVAGGNLIFGIVFFVIITVIQIVVINKGSVRTSEVAARFALDGMPGRQMAIDADLNAGIIDDHEAKRRRDEITLQADFYGSMDGASKFVRGDVIASIVITLVNIVGGLLIGTLYYDMALANAAEVFTKLTIGDGLVSQIPAFLLSLAAGFLITRQSKDADLGQQVGAQIIFNRPEALYIAAAAVGFLALTWFVGSGLPVMQLLLISGSCAAGGYFLSMQKKKKIVQEREIERQRELPSERPKERVEDALKLDALELEVGYALIPLADRRKGGDLEDRIVRVRKQLATELGMILPGVRLRDNSNLPPNDYQVKLKGNIVARGTAYPGHFLAIDTGMTSGTLQGIRTTDPLFGQPAYWVDPSQRERAEMLGYTVVETAQAVTTHLTDTIRKHAAELLNRERVSTLINVVKETSPKVVEEVIPGVMKLGDVQRVLQNLLRENVSIRDLESILETLGDYAGKTKEPDILTEYVRHRLSRSICQHNVDNTGLLRVVTLDPALEDMISAGVEHTDRLTVKLSPSVIEGIGRAIAAEVKKLMSQNRPAVVLVGPQIRAALKQMTVTLIPNLVVLSYNEVTRDTKVESVAMVSYQPQGRQPAGVGA